MKQLEVEKPSNERDLVKTGTRIVRYRGQWEVITLTGAAFLLKVSWSSSGRCRQSEVMAVVSIWDEMGNKGSRAVGSYNGWKVCPESVSSFSVCIELDKQQGKEIKTNLFLFWVFISPWRKWQSHWHYFPLWLSSLNSVELVHCIVRVSIVLSRPCIGLAPLSPSGFFWAALSFISYNLLISEIFITTVAFHLLASGSESVLLMLASYCGN